MAFRYSPRIVTDGLVLYLDAVVLTYNGSAISLYLNGELKGTTSKSGTLTSIVSPFFIGCQHNGSYFPASAPSKTSEYFRGNISNVLLYDKALTDNEVLQNYNVLKFRFGRS